MQSNSTCSAKNGGCNSRLRWRFWMTAVLFLLGLGCLLQLNGRFFDNTIAFIALGIVSLLIWMPLASEKPKRLSVYVMISLHDGLSRNCTVRFTPVAGHLLPISSAKRRGPPRRPMGVRSTVLDTAALAGLISMPRRTATSACDGVSDLGTQTMIAMTKSPGIIAGTLRMSAGHRSRKLTM